MKVPVQDKPKRYDDLGGPKDQQHRDEIAALIRKARKERPHDPLGYLHALIINREEAFEDREWVVAYNISSQPPRGFSRVPHPHPRKQDEESMAHFAKILECVGNDLLALASAYRDGPDAVEGLIALGNLSPYSLRACVALQEQAKHDGLVR